MSVTVTRKVGSRHPKNFADVNCDWSLSAHQSEKSFMRDSNFWSLTPTAETLHMPLGSVNRAKRIWPSIPCRVKACFTSE